MLRVQDSLRKFLNFVAALQHHGGWCQAYSYPPVFAAGTGARGNLWDRDGWIAKKVVGTPTGAMLFLLAHRILGDPDYRAIGERAGSVLLQTQLPAGTWTSLYVPTLDGGYRPHGSTTKFTLQDSAQSHPAKALFYLYQETGKKAYLDAALRTAEFMLKAQNPNGSWSHSYDVKKQMGVTALGYPQGGEFNDECMQAQMSTLAMAYHFTRERRYVEAVRRAGEWVLAAQFALRAFSSAIISRLSASCSSVNWLCGSPGSIGIIDSSCS